MEEIYLLLASSIFWAICYLAYIIPKTAEKSVEKWKEWAMSDDGQETLVQVLGQENGVIDHIAYASGELMKQTLSGGFGAVAKKLNSDPKVAMGQGISKELKNMKWYESALLMKVAGQVPALQPLLGLSEGVKTIQEGPKKTQSRLNEGSNL